jgi:hypothetical protein
MEMIKLKTLEGELIDLPIDQGDNNFIDLKKEYTIDNCSEELRQLILENYHDINTNHDWFDFIYEDFKNICDIIGIKVKNIYFSGFSSQGDGACFTGYYDYKQGSYKNIKEFAPHDEELHEIVLNLSKIQKLNFYKLESEITHNDHYYHYNSIGIEIYNNHSSQYEGIQELEIEIRNLCKWLYKQLEENYDCLVSTEAIIETLQANEYKFNGRGEII